MTDLEHGRRVYDWWGTHSGLYRMVDAIVYLGRRPRLRQLAVDALDLRSGAAVLDLACGPGVNFPLLQDAIGPSGRLVAVDYSPAMLEAARERRRRAGWGNIEFLQDDGARLTLPAGSLDAAICTLGLSVMPAHDAAIAVVAETLRGGGRFAVLDGRTFRGPARIVNPVMKPLLRRTSNWDVEADLVAELEDAFAEVEVEDFNAGSLFVAVARKAGAGSSGRQR